MKYAVHLFAKGHTDVHPLESDLTEVARLIQNDQSIRDLTEKYRYYRSVGDDRNSSVCKRAMPCFAVAVRFDDGKSKQHIRCCTYLSLCDFDDIDETLIDYLLELAAACPHVLMAYRTISGRGLRIIFPYRFEPPIDLDPLFHEDYKQGEQLYREMFLWANRYFCRVLCLPEDAFDTKCCNPTRLSGISHCPELYYRPDAEPLVIPPLPIRKPGRPSNANPYARQPLTLDQALPRVEQYLREKGIFYVPGSRNNYISQACYRFHYYGVPFDDTLRWAQTLDYEDPVEPIVRSCYKSQPQAPASDAAGADRPLYRTATIPELQEYFHRCGITFRRNLLSRKYEYRHPESETWEDLTDSYINTLYVNYCTETHRRANIADFRILIESHYFPDYHPLRQYLEELPQWDGFDYLDRLASTVHVTNCSQERHNRYFKKWFVGMVDSWLQPDQSNHCILTYIGDQGIYKSTFIRHLLPPELRNYFGTKHLGHRLTRDDNFEFTQKALLAFEEIDLLGIREHNQLKAIVGNPHISERGVYERYHEKREQVASFCATGNNPHFLTDPTENRRWLPFLVSSIDSPFDHPFPYEGMYSQAYALCRSGYRYWFDTEEMQELLLHNRDFEEPSMEAELIMTYFTHPDADHPALIYTASQIIEVIGGKVKQHFSTRQISLYLKKLGFQPHRTAMVRGWLVALRKRE